MISERYTKCFPAMIVDVSLPRFINWLIEARETPRIRAASAWEIRSAKESAMLLFFIIVILTVLRECTSIF